MITRSLKRVHHIEFLLRYAHHFDLEEEFLPLLGELGEHINVVLHMRGRGEHDGNRPEWLRKHSEAFRMHEFYFALPCQLDRTKREDLLDQKLWETWGERNPHLNASVSKYGSPTTSGLSYAKDLAPPSIGWNALATRMAPYGVIPEISFHGARRCIFINEQGRRCRCYTYTSVFCKSHIRYKGALGRMANLAQHYKKLFRNSTLAEMYEEFCNSDARDLRDEIALMRTILASVVKVLPEEVNPENLPIGYAEKIINITEKVTKAIEKYDTMQNRMGQLITPDQMNSIMFRMLEVINKCLDLRTEQFVMLAEEMSKIEIVRPVGGYIDLGDTVTADYGADYEGPEVKLTNGCTRYERDGKVCQVPVECEERVLQQQLAARPYQYTEQRTRYYKEGDYHPITTQNGEEVRMCDENDPFYVEEP